jgi:hypothetical protein
MPILKLTESTKKYFISSNLLSDDGIECPDDSIANICALVDDSYEFCEAISVLDLNKLVQLYNFFDEYCISKGTIKLIEIAMNDCKKHKQLSLIGKNDVIIMILYEYGNSIFEAKEFRMNYKEIKYRCTVTNILNGVIKYTSAYTNSMKFGGEFTFVKEYGKIISFTEKDWGTFIVE